jgi:putative DNA primase/helicase
MSGRPPIAEHVIEEARRADLLSTAFRLGARLTRVTAVEQVGGCPRCNGEDRFSVNTRKRAWNCRGAGGGRDALGLVAHVLDLDLRRAEGFREAVAWLTGEEARTPIETPPADLGEDDAANRRSADRIMRDLVPIRGTLGERYLAEARKIDTDALADVLGRVGALGWHPSVYFNEPTHALNGKRLGAIIAIMSDAITAESTGGISRTYLDADGRKLGKAKGLGPAGVIRLSLDEDVLGGLFLAEGLETSLDTMARGKRPMWAAGSTAIMSRFPVLAGVEALTILADRDEHRAGEIAAADAAERWRDAGRAVTIKRRKNGLGDINDISRAQQ